MTEKIAKSSSTPPVKLDAEAVAAYLAEHSEFFVERDELLSSLHIPHQRGSAVSLVERQVSVLRERSNEMRQRLAHLMDVARDNDRLFDKTKRLVLDLLDASSFEEVISAVEDSLRHEFQVPFVSLIMISETPLPAGRWIDNATAQQSIGGLLTGKTISGTLRDHELSFLFGAEQAKQVGSSAVVAINHQGLQGILAIASRDPQHYKSSVGTLFLGYISEILGRVAPRYTAQLHAVR